MDRKQLRALLAVADHRSFSAAARSLHTVQSNVSTHVARLERELGVTLIDRASNEPTDEGRVVSTGPAASRPSSTPSTPTSRRCATRSPARCASG